jgi:hypothetical protein
MNGANETGEGEMKKLAVLALLVLASCGGKSAQTESVGSGDTTLPGSNPDGGDAGYMACAAPQGVSTQQTNDGCYWLQSFLTCPNGDCSQLCPSTQYPLYCRSPNIDIATPTPPASLNCTYPSGPNGFGSANEAEYCCPCQ